MWLCAGAISAARLAAAVLEDGHWCTAALSTLDRLCGELTAAVRAPGSWVINASNASDRAAASLVAALQDSIETARDWSDDHAPPRSAAMTPEVSSDLQMRYCLQAA